MTYDLSRDQWHVVCTMLLSQNTCMHVCPCTRTRAHTHTQWGFTLIFFALCALLLTIAYRACHSSGTFSSLWHTRSRVHADKETQKEISQFALSDIHFGTRVEPGIRVTLTLRGSKLAWGGSIDLKTTPIASFWSKGLRKNTEVLLLPSIVVKSYTPPPPLDRNTDPE